MPRSRRGAPRVGGMADYWARRSPTRRTPADMALDGLRWWQLMTDRAPAAMGVAPSRSCAAARSPACATSRRPPGRRRADARAAAAGRPRLLHRRLQRRAEPDADDPRGRARPPLRAGLDRRHAGDQGRDDHRLPGRGRTPPSRRRATAAPSTSSATARAAGWRRSTRRCTPSASTRSRSPARRSTSMPATRSSTRASQALCDDDLRFFRDLVAPRATACSRASSCSAASSPSSRRTRSASSCSCWPTSATLATSSATGPSRTGSSTPRTSPGPSTCGSSSTCSATTSSSAATLRIGDERGRPRPHRLPGQPPGRRHRPHHAARAGLRAGRRRRHARRAHHARTTSGGHLGLFMGTEALRDHWPVVMASVLEHSRPGADGAACPQARALAHRRERAIPAP